MIAVGPEKDIVIPIDAAAAIPTSVREVDNTPDTNRNDYCESLMRFV
jgi:hypothetical protein